MLVLLFLLASCVQQQRAGLPPEHQPSQRSAHGRSGGAAADPRVQPKDGENPPAPETGVEIPGPGLIDGTVFGQPVVGLHPEMLKKLQDAERRAARLIQPDGTPVTAAQWGIKTVGGFRAGSYAHSRGLAVDLNYYGCPYLIHEKGERRLDVRLSPVYHRIARLLLKRDSVIPFQITRRPGGLRRARKLYARLREESDAMVRYFRLMQDEARLTRFLRGVRPRRAGAYWRGVYGARTAPRLVQLRALMMRDYVTLSGRPGPPISGLSYPVAAVIMRVDTKGREIGGPADRPFESDDPIQRGPERGFLNIRREIVLALCSVGLRWGAIDFRSASGDVMHFDALRRN
jgi:hypothetical protein